MKRFVFIILIILLAVVFLIPSSRGYIVNNFLNIVKDLVSQKSIDYESLEGKWYISDTVNSYIDTYSEGGSVLEIIEIRKDYIKGISATIQLPPANRIASIEFEGKLIDNYLVFNYTDSFNNKGTATIQVNRDSIEITIIDSIIADENVSGWKYSGGIFAERDNSN
jgi:hypothetical protein